jgi:N-acetylmuramoyl-L-alanine amidase
VLYSLAIWVLSLMFTVCSAEPAMDVIKTPVSFKPPTLSKKRPSRRKREPSGMMVIIDPGHGGDDEGAKSLVKPIYCEKNFNLVAARFLQNHLEKLGIRTLMTREQDVFVSLNQRAQMAKRDNEIFVSVHFNAAQSPSAEGIEVFYYNAKDNAERTAKSKALAHAVFTQVMASTEAKPRGVKHGNYHVIRETTVPAILIEGGFLTHADELERIKNPDYLKKLMWGAAQGVASYLKTSKSNISL